MVRPLQQLVLVLGVAAAASAASATSCLIIRDAAAAQDVKIEAHGAHAVRVRAVPAGAAFRDGDDIVSALVVSNSSGTDTAACGTVQLSATSAPASVTSGNLQAAHAKYPGGGSHGVARVGSGGGEMESLVSGRGSSRRG